MSVHKSQGSEYPAVVLVLLMQHYMLLRRNLFYTAVTRGKKLVVVVGDERAIRRAVEDAHVEPRHTRLVERLRACGGDVRVTIYPGVGHDSWTQTYADPQLFAWLLAQRRGQHHGGAGG